MLCFDLGSAGTTLKLDPALEPNTIYMEEIVENIELFSYKFFSKYNFQNTPRTTLQVLFVIASTKSNFHFYFIALNCVRYEKWKRS